MRKRNGYDSVLQMFVQDPRDADVKRLAFLRWLAESGRLEQDVAGPATGSYASDGREETEAASTAA